MYVYSCNALSARFFAVDRALNSYFMIMINMDHIMEHMDPVQSRKCSETKPKQCWTGEVQDQDLDLYTNTNVLS